MFFGVFRLIPGAASISFLGFLLKQGARYRLVCRAELNVPRQVTDSIGERFGPEVSRFRKREPEWQELQGRATGTLTAHGFRNVPRNQ
jgi:hypothetical protein